jgi:hypothetical protein
VKGKAVVSVAPATRRRTIALIAALLAAFTGSKDPVQADKLECPVVVCSACPACISSNDTVVRSIGQQHTRCGRRRKNKH